MRLAIDTGGTFTDCVYLRGARLEILKIFSTPANPARAIAAAVRSVRARLPAPPEPAGWRRGRVPAAPVELLHGTTVGTNALLERRGGRIALVTTAGFEDVLVIGRQARPRLYDFFVTRPPALVPAGRRFGLAERIGPRGQVLIPLRASDLARLCERVRRAHPQAVAVSLLFSFANPVHEQQVARALRRAGLAVSVSQEILPEFREYERTATVVLNAYLTPLMSRYLSEVEQVVSERVGPNGAVAGLLRRGPDGAVAGLPRRGPDGRVGVMQSSGGTVSARVAAAQPVRTLLSGPAGGVVGARTVARLAGLERVISFDMGGTSTDVALLSGELSLTNEAQVGGLPVAVPMLDIHTVGAGGGSLAWFDRGGALRVGPESAGADPGPICYGKGRQPTVTDAHLILGRLDPERFLGGEWRLDELRARRFMREFLRRAPGIASLEELAAGIVRVANATMERAIRVISVERGHDPRQFVLVAFGGAGGLHACNLAAALGIRRVLVPRFPGALSALGILCSDVLKDYSRTVLLPVPAEARGDLERKLERQFRRLEQAARQDLRREGFAPARQPRRRRGQRLARQLDLRYRGQAYELTLAYTRNFPAAFHRAHETRYGYSDPARSIEIVNIRLRALGVTEKPRLRRTPLAGAPPPAAANFKRAPVFFDGRRVATDFFVREPLRAGNRIAGPAVIAEYSATTIIPPGWRARLDAYENLLLEQVS
ncbi:MAG: hydantoinase/oxoprolinase family protein [Candidatus Acidiferrales bacterium]